MLKSIKFFLLLLLFLTATSIPRPSCESDDELHCRYHRSDSLLLESEIASKAIPQAHVLVGGKSHSGRPAIILPFGRAGARACSSAGSPRGSPPSTVVTGGSPLSTDKTSVEGK